MGIKLISRPASLSISSRPPSPTHSTLPLSPVMSRGRLPSPMSSSRLLPAAMRYPSPTAASPRPSSPSRMLKTPRDVTQELKEQIEKHRQLECKIRVYQEEKRQVQSEAAQQSADRQLLIERFRESVPTAS